MDSVCVFCGSRPGNDPAYMEAARATGAAIARRGWRLVYGGGHVGIMGAVADAALAEGGEVVGVMPRSLLTREIAHPDITRLHLVTSMHRRKALMSSLSDGFLTLPGGFGTFEEFFETLTWAQLGLHTKPCALLDVIGYWDALLAMLQTAVDAGFVPEAHLQLVLTDANVETLLDRMAVYVPPSSVAMVPGLPPDGPPVHRDIEQNGQFPAELEPAAQDLPRS
ncbi:MAG: TIGR00730 family Rossman fold protein [Thermomicrobiales bacterium]|nr:TIGR00730 family Rossman fold protein [Thermomicrobiales bacterium]